MSSLPRLVMFLVWLRVEGVRAALQAGARSREKLAPRCPSEENSVSSSSQPLISVPDAVPRMLTAANSLDTVACLRYLVAPLHVRTAHRLFCNGFPN